MNKQSSIFYAKILLFGEYSVITESMALTIPYSHFNGELSFIHEDKYTQYDYAKWSNAQLKALLAYLSELKDKGELQADLEMDRLEEDVAQGLYFESTIPQGYGIGSSGALVASIYDRYANPAIRFHPAIDQYQLSRLKMQFAQIESFYHGTSSGIDPLNSYARYPLLIKNRQDIQAVRIPQSKHFSRGAIFLVDTGKPGKTEPLVNIFMNNIESNLPGSMNRDDLNQVTNNAINSLISADSSSFFRQLKTLSQYQYQHFKPMIPSDYVALWEQGLSSDDFYLKLCGSGGGGFLLGFTPDYQHMQNVFQNQNLTFIPVYKNKNAR
ncbi:MAG: mevalonate kinase family protein [Bacteroidota bacterium]